MTRERLLLFFKIQVAFIKRREKKHPFFPLLLCAISNRHSFYFANLSAICKREKINILEHLK